MRGLEGGGEKSVLDGRSKMCKGPEVSRGCIG